MIPFKTTPVREGSSNSLQVGVIIVDFFSNLQSIINEVCYLLIQINTVLIKLENDISDLPFLGSVYGKYLVIKYLFSSMTIRSFKIPLYFSSIIIEC